ncbi:MAG: helix-turn-helix domain-containing protein [Lachnospiraceae bacterium]|nr:helix-turn-helix domain-containing protein [Lachnospiraceae bacterium]
MVSRDFELYYYSDVGMKTLKMHKHDYYEFYFFLAGEVSLEVEMPFSDTIKKELSPGDLILIPPGIKHHSVIKNEEAPYRRFVFWISTEYCEQLMKESPDYGYLFQQAASFGRYFYALNSADYHAVISKFLRLLEEIHSDRYGKNAAENLCIRDIVLTLNRIIYDENNRPKGGDEESLFQSLISYIEANIEQPLSLDFLAKEFYVSKFYVSHLFKDILGISPHQYILKKRLALCRDAVVSGNVISAVYERYGFRDYSNFFKAFKKEFGISPKEYQNLYGVIKNGTQ